MPLRKVAEFWSGLSARKPLRPALEKAAEERAGNWRDMVSFATRLTGEARRHAGSSVIAFTPEELLKTLPEGSVPGTPGALRKTTDRVNARVRRLLLESVRKDLGRAA